MNAGNLAASLRGDAAANELDAGYCDALMSVTSSAVSGRDFDDELYRTGGTWLGLIEPRPARF